MTAFSSAGRLLPAALRPVVLTDVPEGWRRRAHDPSGADDALAWLGFEPGDPQEPMLTWRRPQRWPAVRPRTGGRHRAPARFRTA